MIGALSLYAHAGRLIGPRETIKHRLYTCKKDTFKYNQRAKEREQFSHPGDGVKRFG
jgi:hypothetical protein